MNFKLSITRKAEKDLRVIPHKEAIRIHAAILGLQDGLKGDVKKLVNHTFEYRIRVGNWRVLFELEGNTVVIARILNRKDACRD